MKLVPIPGTAVRFCIWETRVRDFETFANLTGFQAADRMECLGTLGIQEKKRTWQFPEVRSDA